MFRDPGTGRFHAMITARAREGDPVSRGVIGHAVSDDLLTWTAGPPVTRPGGFGHLEIPQVERVHGAWRLLFSAPRGARPAPDGPPAAVSAVEGTHMLTAFRPDGPYEWSTHQVLDADPACTRYGGRLVSDGPGWRLLAWLVRRSPLRHVPPLRRRGMPDPGEPKRSRH